MSRPYDRCRETVQGFHSLADRAGCCMWCGRHIEPPSARPPISVESELGRWYRVHYDPNWGADRRDR